MKTSKTLIILIFLSIIANLYAESETFGALKFSSAEDFAVCEGCLRLGRSVSKFGNEDVQIGDSFSFEIWLKMDKIPEDFGWAFMHAGPCSYNQCAFLGFQNDGVPVFGFILNDLIVTGYDVRGDVNKWVHWAGTFNAASRDRKLYRNGELIGSDVATSPYTPHSTDLYIGIDNWARHPFPGLIDELRFWRECVLEQKEIREFMCATDLSAHPQKNLLQIHFTFDTNSKTVTSVDGKYSAKLKGEVSFEEGRKSSDCPFNNKENQKNEVSNNNNNNVKINEEKNESKESEKLSNNNNSNNNGQDEKIRQVESKITEILNSENNLPEKEKKEEEVLSEVVETPLALNKPYIDVPYFMVLIICLILVLLYRRSFQSKRD